MLYIAGRLGNILRRGPSGIVASSEDSLYPAANAVDGDPGKPFKAASAAVTNLTLTKDLNLVTNPGFETSTLANWTEQNGGTGSTSESTTGADLHTGTKAMRCVAGTGYASRYQDIEVAAGEALFLDAWIRAVVANETARIRLQNLHTGRYYNGSAWVAPTGDHETEASAVTENGTTLVRKTLAFTMEDWRTCQRNTVTLRVRCINAVGTGAYDDVTVSPQWNWMSWHGHNLWQLTPDVYYSDDGSAFTLVTTGTMRQPSFRSSFAAQQHRWARFRAGGTSIETIYLGELVAGYAKTSAIGPRYGFRKRSEWPQVRHESMSRRIDVYKIAEQAPRILELSFRPHDASQAHLRELRDDIYRACEGGAHPLIVDPDPTRAEEILWGRIMPEQEFAREDLTIDDSSLVVAEAGFPVVGA